jgi:triphosphoribosyl-dephospho-CoA synthase
MVFTIRLKNLRTGDDMEKIAVFNTSEYLSTLAVNALVDEVCLTPKPGLVDEENNGSHHDLTLSMMKASARSLYPFFVEMAQAAKDKQPSQSLRETLGEIGRKAEEKMFAVTNGINTHKGAIWSLGLLIGSVASRRNSTSEEIAKRAGEIARFEDAFMIKRLTNGTRVKKKYGVNGAAGEAKAGFPHIIKFVLPMLRETKNINHSRLNALMAVMAHLDDTCILHRGGTLASEKVKEGARAVLRNGGVGTREGFQSLLKLNSLVEALFVSPGGSADLLAAGLFLYELEKRGIGGNSDGNTSLCL